MWRALKPATIAALVAAIFSVGGRTAQPDCVEWSKAGPIIAQNSLLPANVIYQAVQKKTGGKIVVLGPTGEVTNLTVDALTGQF